MKDEGARIEKSRKLRRKSTSKASVALLSIYCKVRRTTKCEEFGGEEVLAQGTMEILFKRYSLNGQECPFSEAVDTMRWI